MSQHTGYIKKMNSTGNVAVGNPGLILKDNGEYSLEGYNWLDISDNGILVSDNIYSEATWGNKCNRLFFKALWDRLKYVSIIDYIFYYT